MTALSALFSVNFHLAQSRHHDFAVNPGRGNLFFATYRSYNLNAFEEFCRTPE